MENVDRYVYPNTNILINKFDCQDQNQLDRLEAISTGVNLAWLQVHPIQGKFNFQHLKDIHYFIFQDIFEWAGQVRTVDIGKNNLFCRTQFINAYAETIFSDFYKACYRTRENKEKFITELAKHYGDLNALHPFREGNGRTQREFSRELCLKCGYVFDLTQTTYQEMLTASINSFNTGDYTDFILIFSRCVIPANQYQNLRQHLNSGKLILKKGNSI